MAKHVECVNCGRSYIVLCTEKEYQKWRNGTLIQNAMPEVPKEQRELLISGICNSCWHELFQPQPESTTKGQDQ